MAERSCDKVTDADLDRLLAIELAAGVLLVLSSDAHSTAGLANLELAVATARRGSCPPASVVNTRPLHQVMRGGFGRPPSSS